MSQKNKQIATRILAVIFAFYYANICFFYHSHIINGVTIAHSHFHDKAHTQTGTHSESELTLISVLSVFESLQATLHFTGPVACLILLATIRIISERESISTTTLHCSLRAPPSLS